MVVMIRASSASYGAVVLRIDAQIGSLQNEGVHKVEANPWTRYP